MTLDSLTRFTDQITEIFLTSDLYLWLSGGEVDFQKVITALIVTGLLVLAFIGLYKLGSTVFNHLAIKLKDSFAHILINGIKQLYKLILFLGTFYLIANVWGLNFWVLINLSVLKASFVLVLHLAVIAGLGLVVWYLLHQVLARATKISVRRGRTLFQLGEKALKTVITILVGLTILQTLGIDTTFLVTGLGIFGLSVGLASQQLIRDYINCFLFISEDAVRVGDVIKIGDLVGTVEVLNFRTIRLRNLQGEIHVIPYSLVDSLTNLTPGKREMALLDLAISYSSDPDQLVAEVQTVYKQLADDEEFAKQISGELSVLGVNQLGESTVTLRFLIPTASKMKWSVTREFYRRIKKHFDALGINFPYPRQEVALVTEKTKKEFQHEVAKK